MTEKKEKKAEKVVTPADAKKKGGQKAVSVSANESNMSADQKNMQHGGEQPAR
ncbi:hypothetical protein [Mucilaginibacter limnophilus]|uniref:hypothetical protein n=1 Tax=Mucilaginibacter limnophilus TaxID=1932778 RepID=UPI0013E34EFD|nr:hypothetical protein [Mucilaginibacter limnophilus]